jgi:putative DNA primase/helicase
MSRKPSIVIAKKDHVRTAQAFLKERERPLLAYRGELFEYLGTHWEPVPDSDIIAEFWRFASRAKDAETGERVMPTKHSVSNFLEALRSVIIEPSRLTAPFWRNGRDELPAEEIVAFKNYLVHLRHGITYSHTADYFGRHCLSYDYDRSAPVPHEFKKFLKSLWPDDPESRDCLQEIIGYLVSGATDLQKIFGFFGAKRSGKGTIARMLRQLIGPSAYCGPTMSSLAGPFGLQGLIDKKIAVIGDARLGRQSDVSELASRLLGISGEDTMTVSRKYLPDWTGRMGVRFVMLSNEVPRMSDISGALASRFIVLHFSRSFFGKEDRQLESKINGELPGILNWALEGYERLRQRGSFIQPESGKTVLEDLEELSSPISMFIKEKCRIEPGAQVECSELYQAWRDWCESQGREHPGTQQTFGRDLKAALPEVRVSRPRIDGERIRVYEGVSLAQWSAVVRDPKHCSTQEKNRNISRADNTTDRGPARTANHTEVLI